MVSKNISHRPHVAIVGGGFGGLEAAKNLRNTKVDVTLIDRQNYHLFQPLLYQVATGGLSPANIATPLRVILRNAKNCNSLLGEVEDFDLERNIVRLTDDEIRFDYLIVAAGSRHSYFGHNEWEAAAPGLKSLEDAAKIRRKIYVAFEAAEREPDPDVRTQWLTFVIVGGGPTGVELAGAIAEIARDTLLHDFRNINPADARIVIIDASPSILNFYPKKLTDAASRKVKELGIEILSDAKVTNITEQKVEFVLDSGIPSSILSRTVLWAAGVQASELGSRIANAAGEQTLRGGHVPVGPDLTIKGHPNVFVIGDLAAATDADGNRLPGLAPVAIQQGKYVAKQILRRLSDKAALPPFKYLDRGSMATIGRSRAVAKIGNWELSGRLAWWMWSLIHLMEITLFQNRLLVLMQWGWNYITFSRSARLITGTKDLHLVTPNANTAGKPTTEIESA